MIYPTRYPECPVRRRDMARGDITIRQEVRPCMIFEWAYGGLMSECEEIRHWSKGLWHCWVKRKKSEEIPVKYGFKHKIQTVMYALIERKDGRMELVEASRVKFIDSPFDEIHWPEEENQKDKVWEDIRAGKGISREI